MTPIAPRPTPPVGAAEPAAPVRPTRPATGRSGEPGGAFSVAKDLLHPTHYERLGVPADADDVTLSEAYRQAAADDTDAASAGAPAPWPHPGVPENAATRQRQVQLAYQVLQDRERRAVYDRWLAQEQQRLQAASRRWPHGWRWALGTVVVLGLLMWALR
jgi:hypothetical protein